MTIENIIELIKELRARTHLGLTECKKALEDSSGDIEKAIEALQKQGLKKIDDLIMPTEGIVRAIHLPNSNIGFIAEINCQTDFGARSEVFCNFVNEYFGGNHPLFLGGPESYENKLNLVSNQLGEKIVVRRCAYSSPSENPVITIYNHLGGKIAVLMESSILPGKEKDPTVLNLLENVAMQIAANKPLAVDKNSLPSELVQKKIAFYEEEVKFKPDQIKTKILEGKMNKWYSEVALLEQDAIFIGDDAPKGQTVQKEIDGLVVIKKFIRYERGEII